MGLCFIFWSIAFVYISMLTSCLAPQNTPDLIQARLAGNRHHNRQIKWFLKAQISSAALCLLFSTVVMIQRGCFFSSFQHTFLWFPESMLILMRGMRTVKQLWSMRMVDEDNLLLKTQVNDLITDDQSETVSYTTSKTCIFWASRFQGFHLAFFRTTSLM